MKGQLGGAAATPDDEPEPEVWSPETLRRRSEQLQITGLRNESRCEEFELSDTERSQSRSTERSRSQTSSDSQVPTSCRAVQDVICALSGNRQFIIRPPLAHGLTHSNPVPAPSLYSFFNVHLLLSFHLRLSLPSGPFPPSFSTKAPYGSLFSAKRVKYPVHLV